MRIVHIASVALLATAITAAFVGPSFAFRWEDHMKYTKKTLKEDCDSDGGTYRETSSGFSCEFANGTGMWCDNSGDCSTYLIRPIDQNKLNNHLTLQQRTTVPSQGSSLSR